MVDLFWVRDRETVPIFDELVMGPLQIAEDPTFSLKTFFNLSCIPLHGSTLSAELKNATMIRKILRKSRG